MFTLKGRGNEVLSVFGGVGFPGMRLGFRAYPPGLSFPGQGRWQPVSWLRGTMPVRVSGLL